MQMYYPPAPSATPALATAEIGPSRFWWRDTVALVAYPVIMIGGAFAFAPLIIQLLQSGYSEESIGVGLNAVFYTILVALVLFASWKDFRRSMPGKGRYSALHLLWIPLAWLASIVISLVFALGAGGIEQSLNQEELVKMSSSTPYWLMFVVVVLMGPLVEEYIFRHILIGKLSRRKRIEWLMVPITALLFASIHFLSGGDLSLQTIVPYLSQGLVMGSFYVLMRKSFFMVYLLHAFNNFVALSLLYLTNGMDLEAPASLLAPVWMGTVFGF